MQRKELLKSPIDIINNEYEWYLVQYDINPQKFVRKIVNTNDLIWNKKLQNDDKQEKEHVLIQDGEKLHLGYVLYRTKIYQDAIEQQKFIQIICMQLFHSPQETNGIMEHMHFNRNFWLLVMYSKMLVNDEQSIFAIFHKNDVILKKDNYSSNIIAYVQEKESTYKGVVVKVTNDISDMVFIMNIIRNDLLKTLKRNTIIDHEKKNQELHEQINHMEQRMYQEGKVLLQAFQVVDKGKTRLRQRLNYLKNLADMNDIKEND